MASNRYKVVAVTQAWLDKIRYVLEIFTLRGKL